MILHVILLIGTSDKSHYQQLPQGWTSCTIDNLVKTVTDFVASGSFASLRENVKYFDSPNYAILVRTKDFQSNFTNGLVYTDKHGYEFLENSNLFGGELILPNIGASIGKVFIVPKLDHPMTLAPNSIMVKCWDEVTLTWLYYYFLSTSGQNTLRNISSSTAQGKFNKTDFKGICIPVPPLNEQHKIVNQIISIEIILNVIIHNETLLKGTIRSIKSKILDLAMQGKLVSQDPTDEPAADMLLRINPKAKIITDNPQCQNLPSGWAICELRDLCKLLSRGKSPKYSEKPNQYPVFAQKCNLKDGGISLNFARFLDETTIDKWPVKYHILDGDILINSTGTGTVGRTRIFDESCLGNYPFVVPDSHISVIRTFNEVCSKFIFYCLYSNDCQRYFEENLAGSTNQKELYIDVIGDRIIMLPPLTEQYRIVTMVENLYSVLDSIEASLQS